MSRRKTGPARSISSIVQPDRRARVEPAVAVAENSEHVLETERVTYARTDCAQDLVRDRLGGQAGRDLEQPLEGDLVPRRGCRLLRRLERKRGVVGERDEHFELFVGGTATADRLVDRQDAEQMAVGVAQWDEERVLGLPGVGTLARFERGNVARAVVDLAPVELAGRHDVRAAPGEAIVEQPLPVADAANLPE